jgi:hypothetical protein
MADILVFCVMGGVALHNVMLIPRWTGITLANITNFFFVNGLISQNIHPNALLSEDQ